MRPVVIIRQSVNLFVRSIARRLRPSRRWNVDNNDSTSRIRVSEDGQMIDMFIVRIARFIQITHDKQHPTRVVIQLKFQKLKPDTLVSATAEIPGSSGDPMELLKSLKRTERRDCAHMSWVFVWDFIDDRIKRAEEFERFKLKLMTMVDRDVKVVENFEMDDENRLLRFEICF